MMKELEIINTINDIINILPVIFQYVVPGYFCISFYSFLYAKKPSENSYIWKSCIISFVLLSIVQFLRLVSPFNIIPNNPFLNVFASIVLGIVLIGIIYCLLAQEWFQNLITFLFGKSIFENVLEYAIDYEEGSNVKVYLKNKNYYIMGHFKFCEEKGEDSWIVVSAFSKREVASNLLCANEPDHTNDSDVKMIVRLKDIEYMEIF